MVPTIEVRLVSGVAFSLVFVLIIHAVYVDHSFVVLSAVARVRVNRVGPSLYLRLTRSFVKEYLLLDGNATARVLQLIWLQQVS